MDVALYPDASWQPVKGFSVDRALVYAFIRQESKFDSGANNRSSGALGLMQLMPATAEHVAKIDGEKINLSDLREPEVNIRLGQKYVSLLLQDPSVDNNLFKLAAAYNAGPGKLARWEKEVRYEDDPLLFIESIPVSETRIFVERVMTNFWIYRIKYGQDTGIPRPRRRRPLARLRGTGSPPRRRHGLGRPDLRALIPSPPASTKQGLTYLTEYIILSNIEIRTKQGAAMDIETQSSVQTQLKSLRETFESAAVCLQQGGLNKFFQNWVLNVSTGEEASNYKNVAEKIQKVEALLECPEETAKKQAAEKLADLKLQLEDCAAVWQARVLPFFSEGCAMKHPKASEYTAYSKKAAAILKQL